MNREIKFRDYDMDNKQMRYFDLDGYDRQEHDAWGNIMQFTGLHDKNGTAIFEGDIVNQFDLIVKREVVYVNGAFGYYDTDTKHKQFISFAQNNWYEWENGQSKYIEVIGDIFSNPELLTQ